MSVTYTAPKAPAARTSIDLDLYLIDPTKVAVDKETNIGNTRNITYLYDAGTAPNVPLNLFENRQARGSSLRTEVGLNGPYLETDSVSGRSKAVASRSWGLWTVQPAGLLELTPAVVQRDLELLISLWFTSVTSGVADTGKIQKLMDGARLIG